MMKLEPSMYCDMDRMVHKWHGWSFTCCPTCANNAL